MNLQEILQSSFEDLKKITRADFRLLDEKGGALADTFGECKIQKKDMDAFMESAADSQNLRGHLFMKLEELQGYLLIVRTKGSDGYALGQIACSQVRHLFQAAAEELSENQFYRDLFEERLEDKEIDSKAGQLGIADNLLRVVYLIEMEKGLLESGKELLGNLFNEEGKDYIDIFDAGHLVMVKLLKNKKEENKVDAYAQQIVSMLNTEVMATVKVAYGNVAHNLRETAKSFREAKVAQEVSEIFYDGRTVAAYSSLGIGRLIHELPVSLCEMFLDEVFGGRKMKLTDEELTTIDKFFENNLNISETARELFIHRNTLVYHLEKLQKTTGLDIRKFDDALTFKIAVMVSRYLKYLEQP